MKRFIKDLVLNFDLFGPKINFCHQKGETFQSFIGVFLSLLALGLSLGSMNDNLKNVFSRSDPSFTRRTKISENPFNLTRDSFKFFLRFGMFNLTSGVYDFRRKEDGLPKMYISSVERLNFDDNLLNSNYLNLSMVPCDESFFSQYNENLFPKVPGKSLLDLQKMQNQALCLPKELTPDISSIFTNMNDSNRQISISLEYQDMIEAFGTADTIIANINYLDVEYDYDNYNQPHKLVWTSSNLAIYQDVFRQYQFNIIERNIEQDGTFFLFKPDIKIKTYYTIDTIQLDYEDIVPKTGQFSGFSPPNFAFNLSKKLITYTETIKYPSFSGILSDFGGIMGIFNPVCSFLLNIILQPFLTSSLINSTFKFHSNDSGLDSEELIMSLLIKSPQSIINVEKVNLPNNEDDLSKKQFRLERFSNSKDYIINSSTSEDDELKRKKLRNVKSQGDEVNHVDNNLNKEPCMTLESLPFNIHEYKRKRKVKVVGSCDVFRLFFSINCCCEVNSKGFEDVMKKFGELREISSVFKSQRMMNHLIYILFPTEERLSLFLPSQNIDKLLEGKEKSKKNDEENEVSNIESDSYITQIKPINKVKRKLLKSYIRSHL